jgi:uncharacterized membrane protein
MNEAHFHLVINHLPIIFPIVGLIVLITGFISKSEAVKRTSYLVFIIGSLITVVAMESGEGAEDIAEQIRDVSKTYIENHEEAAEMFSISSYVLGVLSLIGLWASFNQKSFANSIASIILVFVFLVLFFAKQTGTTGGEIRHPEIRPDYNKSDSGNINNEKDND